MKNIFFLAISLLLAPQISFATQEKPLYLFATCADVGYTWYVRVEGHGHEWTARTTVIKGVLDILNPSKGIIFDQTVQRVNLVRNFMDFGQVSVSIPIQRTDRIPYDALTLSDGFAAHDGLMQTSAFLRPSLRSSEYVSLKCESNKSEGWREFIKQHDLQLLNEEAPASVCKINYKKEGLKRPSEAGCSGTLVGPNQLLTAAHCDVLMSKYPAFVECSGEAPRPVFSRKSHPLYNVNDASNPHDVALFGWQEPITTIKPVKIDTDLDGSIQTVLNQPEDCRLYGYGTRSDRSFGNIGVAPLVPLQDFAGGKSYMSESMRKGTLGTDPEAFIRPGDSGGPVLCKDRRGDLQVIAVHSFIAIYDSSANSAMVAYPANKRWIQENLK